MSYRELKHLLASSNLPSQDRVWFARWVDRYRRYCRVQPNDPVPISRESVIAFLQQQKACGRQAWQRLQMVKALQFYQTSVCRCEATDLDDIRETLAQFVRRQPSSQPQAEGFIDVVGKIDPNEPEPIQELRRRLRLLGGEYSTEKAYVKWATQFVQHYRIKSIEQLKSLGEAEVTEFLTELAVERNVAAGTQNQAFSALLKLFSQVARKDLRGIDAVRASKPRKLPLVLIHSLLENSMRNPEADLRRLASAGLSGHGLDPMLAEKAVETVRAVMGSDLWKRAQDSTKLLVEVPFQRLVPIDPDVTDSLPTILRGVIDLVFRENQGWTVVDYKTDARPESELPKLVEHYRGQVETYATFWQETTGEPVAEKGLYFTHTGRYVRL